MVEVLEGGAETGDPGEHPAPAGESCLVVIVIVIVIVIVTQYSRAEQP